MGSLWTGLQLALQHLLQAIRRRPATIYHFRSQRAVEPFSTPTKKLPCPKTAIVLHQHVKAFPSRLRQKKHPFAVSYTSHVHQDLHHLPQGFLRVYHRVGKDLLDVKEILVEVIPLFSLSKLYYISWRRVVYSVSFSASSPGSASLRRRI